MFGWRRSGLGVAQYAARHGYSAQSLARWAREVDATDGETPRFVRLEVAARPPTPPVIIELGRARIVVEPGFDAEHLLAVVVALCGGDAS